MKTHQGGEKVHAVIATGKPAYIRGQMKTIKARKYAPMRTEETLDEAMRIVSKHEYRGRKAVVYRNPEYDEYQVKFHHNGQHLKDADSFHSDKEDAQGTARYWVSHAHPEGTNEETISENDTKCNAFGHRPFKGTCLDCGAPVSQSTRPGYSAVAVDKAIKSSRKKISGREAKAIHRLLKGRH